MQLLLVQRVCRWKNIYADRQTYAEILLVAHRKQRIDWTFDKLTVLVDGEGKNIWPFFHFVARISHHSIFLHTADTFCVLLYTVTFEMPRTVCY